MWERKGYENVLFVPREMHVDMQNFCSPLCAAAKQGPNYGDAQINGIRICWNRASSLEPYLTSQWLVSS